MDGFSSSPDRAFHAGARPRRGGAWLAGVALAGGLLLVTGCAGHGGIRQTFDKTLQAVGLKAAAPPPHSVPLRFQAGDNLNAGDGERGVSLVVRVYQLRERKRFEDAAFEVFLDEQRERDVLGDDLLGVTEFLLAPGQRHEVLEPLPADGRHVGVVSLFRAPAPTRWRLVFDAGKAAGEGVTIGLHACAITTQGPALETVLATPPHSLSSSRCPPLRR